MAKMRKKKASLNRAIILKRMSTDKQDLETQDRVSHEFCDEYRLEVVGDYEEKNVSGFKTALANRTELQEILERSDKLGDFDHLIVYKFDRLIRRQDEALVLMNKLRENQITLVESCTKQIVKNEDLNDFLLSYIKSWTAENESRNTGSRVHDKLRTKNLNGEWSGGKAPFGYEIYSTGIEHPTKRKFIHDIRVNENEANIVKVIFWLYTTQFMGTTKIANYLNSPTNGHAGKNRIYRKKDKTKNIDDPDLWIEYIPDFRQSTIAEILRNPIYVGTGRYNTKRMHRDYYERFEKSEWMYRDYRDELRLVSDEVFNTAQELLDKKKCVSGRTSSVPSSANLLCAGMAYCECGGKLQSGYSGKVVKTINGKTKEYASYRYACTNGKNHPDKHREEYEQMYYGGKKYDGYVMQFLYRLANRADELGYEKIKERFDSITSNSLSKEIREIQAKIKTLKDSENKLQQKMIEDIDNSDIYIDGIRSIKVNIKTLEAKISKNKAIAEETIRKNKEVEEFAKTIISLKNILDNGTLADKKIALSKLCHKVTFTKEGIICDTKIDTNIILGLFEAA